jgi:chemotaxis methyl-accepting protein methylase
MSKKNVLVDFLKDYLDRSLRLRFDICTCSDCRDRMIGLLFQRVPPVFADTDDPAYKSIERAAAKDNIHRVFEATNRVIEEVSQSGAHSGDTDKEKAFDNLIEKIKEARGIDFSSYHRGILKRRLALRLDATNSDSYVKYLKVLAADPNEYDRLFDELTINVSEFFRDVEMWGKLKNIIGRLAADKKGRAEPVTIWSAACSGGEEPYSIAMTTKMLGLCGAQVKILATDVDKQAIKAAMAGVYKTEQLSKVVSRVRNLMGCDIGDYFSPCGQGRCINPDIKIMVDFQWHDLVTSEYPVSIDIILCRNVFIYFTKGLQERVLDRFYRSLSSSGYLVIGKSETLAPEARVVFRDVDLENKIFQKRD